MVDSTQASRHAEAMDTSSTQRQAVFLFAEYQFAKAPVKSGVGLADAAATGERVCPKCFVELGDRRSEVVAECLLSPVNMT